MSSQDNVNNLRKALEAWAIVERRSEYFQLYAPDAEIHTHGATSVDGLRQFYAAIWEAFPDAKPTLEDVVGEGDKVAYRVSVTGTHRGAFAGLPSTGKRIAISEIGILHFSNGKIVRRWVNPMPTSWVRNFGADLFHLVSNLRRIML